MRNAYGQPFEEQERFSYREVLAANALQRSVVTFVRSPL